MVDCGILAQIRCADRIVFPTGRCLVDDKGYDSTALRDRIWDAGSCPFIPKLKNRKNPARWHRGFYRLRHRVEDFFQRIKRFRWIGSCNENLFLHFVTLVQLAAIVDWLKCSF
jgi:putative transposase